MPCQNIHCIMVVFCLGVMCFAQFLPNGCRCGPLKIMIKYVIRIPEAAAAVAVASTTIFCVCVRVAVDVYKKVGMANRDH